jgi:hypothetical protein
MFLLNNLQLCPAKLIKLQSFISGIPEKPCLGNQGQNARIGKEIDGFIQHNDTQYT